MGKISSKQIAEAIYRIIEDDKNSGDLALSIAAYLVAEHQTKDMDHILREVERLRYERDGKLEIVANTRHGLSDSTKEAISHIFDARDSKIIEQRNEDLVGGVSIQALDKWLDLSIRGRLKRLRSMRYDV